MKQIIRLTESDLHRLVKESVRRILREMDGGSIDGGNAAGMTLDFGENSTGGNGAGNGAGLNRDKTNVDGDIQMPAFKGKDKSLTRPKGDTTGVQDKANWNVNM